MAQGDIKNAIVSIFIRCEGIMVCVITVEFRSRNKNVGKKHMTCMCFMQLFSDSLTVH